MKFFTAALLALSGSFVAAFDACPTDGLFVNAVCCDSDVLGVVGLNCRTVSRVPESADDFVDACDGSLARCCVLPVADQGVLCQKPVGVSA